MSTTVSIIGSAGRTGTVNETIYKQMLQKAEDIIQNEFKLDFKNITLVSGGAAFADHVAVDLFSKYSKEFVGLILYLPCAFTSNQFEDNGKIDFRTNPGGTANYYHRKFSQKLNKNSLQDLGNVEKLENVIFNTSYKGFHARNSEVAKSDYLIAFTWSAGSEPDDSGTADTWRKSKSSNKVHVSLK